MGAALAAKFAAKAAPTKCICSGYLIFIPKLSVPVLAERAGGFNAPQFEGYALRTTTKRSGLQAQKK